VEVLCHLEASRHSALADLTEQAEQRHMPFFNKLSSSFFDQPVSKLLRNWTQLLLAVSLAVAVIPASVHAASATLDAVKSRGFLRCGVNADLAGFSRADSLGEYTGFDVEICRAVAIAVLNNSAAVEFVPTSATDRFDALLEGEFDVLSRNTTYTMQRNALYGEFAGIVFYDGQGFMVRKRLGIRSALELDNIPICVSRGTTTELNASDFFSVSEMRYRPVLFDDEIDAAKAYEAGECEALTTDRSGLAAQRTTLETPEAHILLPEIISKEPLGPAVRDDDVQWEKIVKWSINCLINAEEIGLTRGNISARAKSSDPATMRIMGTESELGSLLGIDKFWCANIISGIGNYAEIYERNVGPSTAIGLERGVNSLWTDGGLLYAPPIR